MENINNFNTQYNINPKAAKNLVHSTKSVPMMEEITPRWLLSLLPWIQVEAGIYRVNRLKNYIASPQQKINAYNSSSQHHADKLRDIPPFKYMDQQLFDTIKDFLALEEYDAGNIITNADSEGDKLYLVSEGKLEVATKGKKGEKLNIGLLSDGDFSDIDAFIEKSKRPVHIKALSPCTLLSLDRHAFEKWINQSPKMYDNFEKAMKKWSHHKEKTNDYGEKLIELFTGEIGDHSIPDIYHEYEEKPREYPLSCIQTVLRMNTQITDIFNKPINQLEEQMRLTIESMKERQEWELINNKEFGLLHNVAPSMRVPTKKGAPTPDDMDELLAKVWKKPAFFLAHPKAIAAFGRECTKRGVPPTVINMFGSPFITWRGVPIVPCDKLLVNGRSRHNAFCGTTKIVLVRVGEKEQGVIGLHQAGIPDETTTPSLSVKFGGIDNKGIASHILSLYYSLAVLTDDALGVLDDVEVGYYHDYE